MEINKNTIVKNIALLQSQRGSSLIITRKKREFDKSKNLRAKPIKILLIKQWEWTRHLNECIIHGSYYLISYIDGM